MNPHVPANIQASASRPDRGQPDAPGPTASPTASATASPTDNPTAGHDCPGTGLDDAGLIRRSLEHPDFFADLFRRHAAGITRYVARRIGQDAADDVVADTFLAAFANRGKYHLSQPDARPWLYGIATNLTGRHRRAEIRQYRAYARTGVDPVTEPFTEPCEKNHERRARRRARKRSRPARNRRTRHERDGPADPHARGDPVRADPGRRAGRAAEGDRRRERS
jgi:DNA-directed RNA polymerase specialized sigma24 family protein